MFEKGKIIWLYKNIPRLFWRLSKAFVLLLTTDSIGSTSPFFIIGDSSHVSSNKGSNSFSLNIHLVIIVIVEVMVVFMVNGHYKGHGEWLWWMVNGNGEWLWWMVNGEWLWWMVNGNGEWSWWMFMVNGHDTDKG